MEPVIRNYRSVYQPGGAAARLISLDDHPATCTMTYSVISNSSAKFKYTLFGLTVSEM